MFFLIWQNSSNKQHTGTAALIQGQGSTLTAARLPGATKNFIGATKFQIPSWPIGQLKMFVTVVG